MAYKVNNNRTTRDVPPKVRSGQEGVTLLLTLMIMAALSAIVFSISALALNEIQTSQNESASEPAITAAEGAAEEQLFVDQRGLGSSCSASGSETFPASGASATYQSSYYYDGAYNFGLTGGNSQTFYLYNPCVQNGAPGYTSISVQQQNTATTDATVNLCSWNDTNCLSNPDIDSKNIAPGGIATFPNSEVSPSTQYQVVVIDNDGDTNSVNYSISTTANSSGIIGIPANQVTIITTGTKDGTTRKLLTQLPQ